VNVAPAEENLHYAWDDAVVAVLEKQLGTTGPEATARKLERSTQSPPMSRHGSRVRQSR
jgi:hypothetical protein